VAATWNLVFRLTGNCAAGTTRDQVMSLIAAVGLNPTSSLAVTIRRNRGYAVRSIAMPWPPARQCPLLHAHPNAIKDPPGGDHAHLRRRHRGRRRQPRRSGSVLAPACRTGRNSPTVPARAR